ncbi:hypothetical protein L218DRAFT_999837 [Marasmius fiardii PR-910]|nr:hypothetical protein L218DRAFT_999837 [Marasmius fiardii PR-910]
MSSSSDEEWLAPFLNVEHTVTYLISTLSAVFFVYGIYCVVFGLSIHALFRNGSSAHKLHKGGSIALFVLATIYTAIETWGLSRQTFISFSATTTGDYAPLLQYVTGDVEGIVWGGIQSFISTLMNTIVDAMLIHRCYVIFNSDKFILYPLVFVAIILNGIDLGSIIAGTVGQTNLSDDNNRIMFEKALSVDDGAVISMAAFQIVLTFMTGGRVWWITREAKQLMGGSTHSKLNRITAIIIESALLYAGTLLTIVVQNNVWDPNGTGFEAFSFIDISVLMSGLAPTMVIARVAYGKSIDSVQQTLSMLHIADIEASQQGTIDLHLQTGSAFNGKLGGFINLLQAHKRSFTSLNVGGRIWWITREAKKLAVGRSTHSRLNDIIAIIIESALLYAGTLLTTIVVEKLVWDPDETGIKVFSFMNISSLISGLAPTMVIARVAYGKSVDSVQQTLSTFHIAEIEASQQRTINLHLQTGSGIRIIQEGASELPVEAAKKV